MLYDALAAKSPYQARSRYEDLNGFHYPDHRFRRGYVYLSSLPSLAHSELGRGINPRPSIDEALFGRTRTHKLGAFNGGAYSPGSSLIHWGRPGVSIVCSLGNR